MQPMFEKVLDANSIGPSSKVLDVGCGTGLLCALAAGRGAEVAGIDASAGQLAVARERLPDADFEQGDMENLPFESGKFDLVTCCNALQYATNPVAALREMKRVATPDGTIGIMTRGSKGPHGGNAYAAALEPFQEPKPADAPPMTIFREPGNLEAAIQEVGLIIYADEDVQCDWNYPDLETALRGILSGAPAVRAIRRHGDAPLRDAVSAALEPYRTVDGGYHIPHSARFVLARPA